MQGQHRFHHVCEWIRGKARDRVTAGMRMFYRMKCAFQGEACTSWTLAAMARAASWLKRGKPSMMGVSLARDLHQLFAWIKARVISEAYRPAQIEPSRTIWIGTNPALSPATHWLGRFSFSAASVSRSTGGRARPHGSYSSDLQRESSSGSFTCWEAWASRDGAIRRGAATTSAGGSAATA